MNEWFVQIVSLMEEELYKLYENAPAVVAQQLVPFFLSRVGYAHQIGGSKGAGKNSVADFVTTAILIFF